MELWSWVLFHWLIVSPFEAGQCVPPSSSATQLDLRYQNEYPLVSILQVVMGHVLVQ